MLKTIPNKLLTPFPLGLTCNSHLSSRFWRCLCTFSFPLCGKHQKLIVKSGIVANGVKRGGSGSSPTTTSSWSTASSGWSSSSIACHPTTTTETQIATISYGTYALPLIIPSLTPSPPPFSSKMGGEFLKLSHPKNKVPANLDFRSKQEQPGPFTLPRPRNAVLLQCTTRRLIP